MKIEAKDPDSYIAAVAAERRPQLEKLRGLVRKSVPGARESIMWGMIAYEYEGRPFAALASQKNYMSIYLMDLYNEPSLRDKHRVALAKLQMGKSCVNFDSVDELPLAVIGDILQAAPTVKAKPTAKKAAAKKPVAKKPIAKKAAAKKAVAKKKPAKRS